MPLARQIFRIITRFLIRDVVGVAYRSVGRLRDRQTPCETRR